MTQGTSGPGAELALDQLRTLSYAASFIRTVGEHADSITFSLPPLEWEAARALEHACALAVRGGLLEAEISFRAETTYVRFARPGRL